MAKQVRIIPKRKDEIDLDKFAEALLGLATLVHPDTPTGHAENVKTPKPTPSAKAAGQRRAA